MKKLTVKNQRTQAMLDKISGKSTPDVTDGVETLNGGSLHPVVMPRRIAWSTKSASNGYIYQWSRWHLTHTLVRGEKTLCGETLPFAKWITPQPGDTRGDYRIKGGECQECKRHNEKGQR